jgi:hypothetical protein
MCIKFLPQQGARQDHVNESDSNIRYARNISEDVQEAKKDEQSARLMAPLAHHRLPLVQHSPHADW